MRKAIAIDFDGCLCTNEYPAIGQPNWAVINRAKAEQQAGAGLILWTCREDQLLLDALEACESWGLTFDAVNESLPDWIEEFKTRPRKVGTSEYWDDKAVQMPYKMSDEYYKAVDALFEDSAEEQTDKPPQARSENAKLCPFRGTTERWTDSVTGQVTTRKRFQPCTGKNCMAYLYLPPVITIGRDKSSIVVIDEDNPANWGCAWMLNQVMKDEV